MSAREYISGHEINLWRDDLLKLNGPPFDLGRNSLYVAFAAVAEMSAHISLSWGFPLCLLDLHVEMLNRTNGLRRPDRTNLLWAQRYFKIDGIDGAERQAMRELALRGTEFTTEEREALIDYCRTDTLALWKLFPRVIEGLNIRQALYRGRYLMSVAVMESLGIPVDRSVYELVRKYRDQIQGLLIEEIDPAFGVYENHVFKMNRFAELVRREGYEWPVTKTGQLSLKDEVFRDMGRVYPKIQPLRELRKSMSQLRGKEGLDIGEDGRCRLSFKPFQQRNSRCNPSAKKFVFSQAKWQRSFIKPEPGTALIYSDFSGQEIGVAAALSGDENMMRAYRSGDVYLDFAKQNKIVPLHATRQSHADFRNIMKAAFLGINYGSTARGLARRIQRPTSYANQIILYLRRSYPKFFEWQQSVVDHGKLNGVLTTKFGWRLHIDHRTKHNTLLNFLMPATGGEVLRWFTILAIENELRLLATIHDGALVEVSSDSLEADTAKIERLMKRASAIVLDGFELDVETKVFKYPDRFVDPAGKNTWETVSRMLAEAVNSSQTG